MDNKENVIDGTKLVAKDIANILNEYPMCEVVTDTHSIKIVNHRGYVIKEIYLG